MILIDGVAAGMATQFLLKRHGSGQNEGFPPYDVLKESALK